MEVRKEWKVEEAPLIPFDVKLFLVRISDLQDKKYTNNLFVLLKWKIYVNINYRK